MPLRVHAIVVTRHGATSHARVLRTLDVLGAQTRPPDEVTLVVCGDDTVARESATVAAGVTRVMHARTATSFAAALAQALPAASPETALWLLDDDTVPAPDALELLAASLERSPMAALAAPKLRTDTEPPRIASFGVSMTRLGRSVELTAGQIDQGQHDGDEDALAADVRGMLVRGMGRERLVPDPALGAVDVGLDLSVRARLDGERIALTPAARAEVTGEGPAAPPHGKTALAYARRRAQLHRRLAYAPAFALPLHWLLMLPLALWRSLLSLLDKRPDAILPEWGAAIVGTVRLDQVTSARSRIRRARSAGWAAVAPLRTHRGDPGRKLVAPTHEHGETGSELRFFAGGGAWAVLVALVAGIVAFVPLLTWPVLRGGGLLPLRETVAGLWGDTAWGVRAVGTGVVGPADPFSAVVAALGTLSPFSPSVALVALWLLALPLAVLGGWFAATRVTDRASLRVLAGVLWALAPTFLTALVQARPAAVILHLVLPWFVFTAAAAHRSWGAAGAASLLLVPVIACAPSLAPAVVVLWLLAIVVALIARAFAATARLAWVPVPVAVVFAPLVLWQRGHTGLAAVFADPGLAWLGPQAGADATGRLVLATGFPGPDYAGWAGVLGTQAHWASLLLAPLALLALLAPIAPRWRVGMAAFAVLCAGLATALVAPGIAMSFVRGTPAPLWPGSGLSLAWVGLLGAALVTLETALPRWRLRRVAASVLAVAAVVCALPALTALARGDSLLQGGPESTLPAYVAADARGDLARGTLVITPLGEAAIAARAVWGPSDTLGAQSTLVATATEPLGTDISELAVDLISSRVFDAASALSELGIRYVLLGAATGEQAAELRLAAATALGQRADFVKVGDTDKGALWRVDGETASQAPDPEAQRTAGRVRTLTLLVLGVALLLALPTRSSRYEARRRSRVVGGDPR